MRTLSSLFDIYQFTPGRIAFCVKQVASLAKALGDSEVAAEAAPVVELAMAAILLERQWQSGQLEASSRGGGAATLLDSRVDRLVGAIYTMATTYQTATESNDPHRAAAEKITRVAFPQGAGFITSKSYEDEIVAVDLLLRQLDDELSAEAKALALGS